MIEILLHVKGVSMLLVFFNRIDPDLRNCCWLFVRVMQLPWTHVSGRPKHCHRAHTYLANSRDVSPTVFLQAVEHAIRHHHVCRFDPCRPPVLRGCVWSGVQTFRRGKRRDAVGTGSVHPRVPGTANMFDDISKPRVLNFNPLTNSIE